MGTFHLMCGMGDQDEVVLAPNRARGMIPLDYPLFSSFYCFWCDLIAYFFITRP